MTMHNLLHRSMGLILAICCLLNYENRPKNAAAAGKVPGPHAAEVTATKLRTSQLTLSLLGQLINHRHSLHEFSGLLEKQLFIKKSCYVAAKIPANGGNENPKVQRLLIENKSPKLRIKLTNNAGISVCISNKA